MYSRADIRHTCYRKKNGAEYASDKQALVDLVESVKRPGDKWEEFSDRWDVFVSPTKIYRIEPEVDYQFVNNTCIEYSSKLSAGMIEESLYESLEPRKRNIIDLIKLNYLGEEVDWQGYGSAWTVEINYQAKRIEVNSTKTVKNKVSKPKPVELKYAVSEAIEVTPTSKEDLDPKILSKIKALIKGAAE